MSYFQTTRLPVADLVQAMRTAKRQDDAVLAFFRHYRGECYEFTPSHIHIYGQRAGMKWLLTSVRRSFNTLTKSGLLVKTDDQMPGPFGKPQKCWKLADKAAV